jgi:hypothetical protein
MGMHKGHMDQTRKNVRSTKTKRRGLRTNTNPRKRQPPCTNFTFATIEDTGKIYTNQTGRFPVTSRQGHKYILILYEYDSNAILTERLKSRNGGEILQAYTKLFEYLKQRGLKPQTHWLDNNEAPRALKSYDTQQQVTYQLVPPDMHRRNAAERAIRTWKNHFTACLCSTDKEFPMHLWHHLINQATLTTLNLLRASRRNPKVSAYSILEGTFDFNATPMAPPGTKVLIHK